MIREAAGDRFGELELNTYATGGPTVVTGDPRAEARRRADRIREQTGVEFVEEILDSPHVFIGNIKDLRASSRTCASVMASAHSSSTTWTHWRRWWRNSPDSEARPPDGQFRRQPPGRIRRIVGAGQHVQAAPLKAAVVHVPALRAEVESRSAKATTRPRSASGRSMNGRSSDASTGGNQSSRCARSSTRGQRSASVYTP